MEAALLDRDLLTSLDTGRTALYRAFNKIWSAAHYEVTSEGSPDGEHEAAASARLARITPLSRQALLLTTLEEFSSQQAGEIMELEAGDGRGAGE